MDSILEPKNIKIMTYIKNDKNYYIDKNIELDKNCKIKFYSIDPQDHNEYDKDQIQLSTFDIVEKILSKLSKAFSGKNYFWKVLTSNDYDWVGGSPFDDVIIAYSNEPFTLKQASKQFNKNQDN